MIDFSRIRLICSDIDGTLLGRETELPERIKAEIWRLHSQGIGFTFATGRMPYETDHLFRDIPPMPYTAGNGALVKQGDAILREAWFTPEPLRDLAEAYSALGVTVIFTAENQERPYKLTPWALENAGLFPGLDTPAGEEIWRTPLQRMFFYHPQGSHLEACARDLAAFSQYSASFQNPKSIQIAPAGCTKASGVQALARLLDIPREAVLCVGDAHNDLPMIRWAGLGAAVGNACPELKQAARWTATRPGAAGVAELLSKCGRN